MRRRGVVAAVVVVSLVALLSVVALTTDVGLALAERRQAQAAADTAALAGATDLFDNWWANNGSDSGGSAVATAKAVAQASGFQDGVGGATVKVNVPGGTYQGGPNAGSTINPGYVEVVVQYNQPAVFSRIFRNDPISISARSVAAAAWRFAPPIVVLDPSNPTALLITGGNGTVNVPNGPVYVNSTDPAAMSSASAGSMNALQYYIVGNTDSANQFTGGPLLTGVHPIADPLLYIPQPDPSRMTAQTVPANPAADGYYHLQPGRYDGGIAFGTRLRTGTANVTMAQGVYYMNGGGFTFNSSGTLDGSAGVMIFNGGSSPGFVTIVGTGTVTLRPLPASYGLLQGITIFQDRAATQLVAIDHLPTSNLYDIKGAIYAAGAEVSVQRQNGDTDVGSQFICYDLNLVGTGTMNVPGQYVRSRSIGGVE
jgi:hypothetical protein